MADSASAHVAGCAGWLAGCAAVAAAAAAGHTAGADCAAADCDADCASACDMRVCVRSVGGSGVWCDGKCDMCETSSFAAGSTA